MARHRKQTTPFPGRLTAVVSGDAPRHRTESGLRGGAVAAAAAGAVLFAGYQAAVPAPAQAQPAADQRGIVTHEALKSVAVDVRTALETAAGDARVAAAAEDVAGSLGSALPSSLSGARAVVPAPGRLTSGFGPRWGTTHYGIDIAGDIGTPIFAAADGTVTDTGPASGFGCWVRIAHDDGTETVYGHINRSLVEPGQRVPAGQPIATIGERGDATGPHLHFETWDAAGDRIDPEAWLAQRGAALGEGIPGLGSLGSGSLRSGSVEPGSSDPGSLDSAS